MPDFTQASKFNKEANFKSVKFGADAPLLETELNELQDIQHELTTSIAKEILPNGVDNTSRIVFSNGSITINNCKFLVEGNVLNVKQLLKLPVSNNETVYLEVFEEVKTFQDSIKRLGNSQTSENVPNEIGDIRIGIETSRRVQVIVNLVKQKSNQNAKYLEIGQLSNNVFNVTVLNYNNSFKFQDKDGKLYICFRQLNKEGKPQIIFKEVI